MVVFFFKQKTAYEMRISDWSSDVCSSDLRHPRLVVDERKALADEPVEQRRLAHIGPADNGNRRVSRHDIVLISKHKAINRAVSPSEDEGLVRAKREPRNHAASTSLGIAPRLRSGIRNNNRAIFLSAHGRDLPVVRQYIQHIVRDDRRLRKR